MTFPFPHSGGRRKQEEEAPQLALVPSAERKLWTACASSDVNTLTPD